MTIHIEICKSLIVKGTWRMRIGDISGGIEISNILENELIEEIKEQLKMEDKLSLRLGSANEK